VRKLDGVYRLPDVVWLKNNSISSFLQDLANAIRREVNVLTFMIEKR